MKYIIGKAWLLLCGITGEKKATWIFPDDSVLWNNWGGITVLLDDGDFMMGGFFAIKRYDTGGLR